MYQVCAVGTQSDRAHESQQHACLCQPIFPHRAVFVYLVPVCVTMQLTALCVSTLLEHLLQGDELIPNRERSPNDGSRRSRNRFGSDQPPGTTAHGASPPDVGAATPAAATPPRSPAPPQYGEADPALPSSSMPPEMRASSPSPLSPIIFVGFGTGANALLHLVASPALAPFSIGKDRDGRGDDGDDAATEAGSGGRGGDDSTRGGDDSGGQVGGSLIPVLRHNGLRVGGLVLVNGFVSLDEQSTHVSELALAKARGTNQARERTEPIRPTFSLTPTVHQNNFLFYFQIV